MVIDSSAIIAALLREPEAKAIIKRLATRPLPLCLIAAPTLLETRIVLQGMKQEAIVPLLKHFIERRSIVIEPFTHDMVEIAIDAYKRFHRGKNGLNFGDCFAYALAKARNEPLLCKGNDFKHTDIAIVEY